MSQTHRPNFINTDSCMDEMLALCLSELATWQGETSKTPVLHFLIIYKPFMSKNVQYVVPV